MISLLKVRIKQYFQLFYVRSAIKLVSGTALAQGISIATAPILYRIYEKEDYGTLGLYMALIGSIGAFSTLQYNQAVFLEKEDKDALQVLWLIRIINVSLSLLTFVLILLFGSLIANYLNNPNISPWLMLLPVSIYFSGQNEVFRIWANRKKQYSTMAWNSVITAILVPFVSISLGLVYKSPLGLFLGLLTSQIVPAFYMGWILSKTQSFSIRTIQLDRVKHMAIKYISFPKYTLPSDFINRFSNQLPVFMLSAYAGPSVVAVYNLSIRMLGLPVQLIAGSIGEIFRQQATYEYNTLGNCTQVFIRTLKTLILFATPVLIIVIFWGPDLFAWYFGPQWKKAGELSQILSFLYFFNLISSPLSYLFYLANKQKQDFLWHLLMLLLIGASFYVGLQLFDSYIIALQLFVLSYSFIYIIYLVLSYKYTKYE